MEMLKCNVRHRGELTDGAEWYSLEHNVSLRTLNDWVDALRSDDYPQVHNALHFSEADRDAYDDDFTVGYCCLGVLGSVCGISNDDLRTDTLLNDEMSAITGMIPDTQTCVAITGTEENPKILQDLLSKMNDMSWTFSQIADWIEENLIKSADEIRI